jgi:hypothetical protein
VDQYWLGADVNGRVCLFVTKGDESPKPVATFGPTWDEYFASQERLGYQYGEYVAIDMKHK